jgi:hypothetical protein
MARAYGSNAHLLMKRESVYGQAVTGNYIRMPFNRCNLGSEQGLTDDTVLGQARIPRAPPTALGAYLRRLRRRRRRDRQAHPREGGRSA